MSFGAVSQIHACLTDPEYGPSLAAEKSAFMYTVRDEGLKDHFDYLKHHVRQTTVYIYCVTYMVVFSLRRNRLVGNEKTKDRQPDIARSSSFLLLEWPRHLKYLAIAHPLLMVILAFVIVYPCPTCLDFPWEKMAPGSTFCDIGGGVGGVCLELAKAHSHLKLTLQDQPHILDKAREVGCLKYKYLLVFSDHN
jgi:hypothetical protein